MKCIATFVGVVTCVQPGGTRIVEVWRPYKKGAFESFITKMNRKFCKGFKVGQVFRSRVLKEKGKPAKSVVTKVKPIKLTEKQFKRIEREVEKELEGIDLDSI